MRLNACWRLGIALIALTPCTALAAAEPASILVDGRLDEAAWSQAQVFKDFSVVEPYTLVAPAHPTEVRLLSTPAGIAIGFRSVQPPGVPRLNERTPRDADIPGDRVNVFIDFNADGEVAYNFTLALSGAIQDATLTNENQYSPDWDGDWQHAVAEDAQGWTAEYLLPWSVAAMRDSGTPRRTIAVMFDRVLGTPFERSGFPKASFSRPRFVSEFHRLEIDQYQQSVFHVFPYVSAAYDFVGDTRDAKTGADLYWKPSGDFQLTAALSPDFGQVEADELVVNFDAVESFFSDRRPFFTENQALFDLRTPDNGLLIYTRRIGGPADDGSGAAQIDIAGKITGSAFGLGYGVLAAREAEHADDLGSLFYAQRLLRSGDELSLGYLGTYADRPYLERESVVHALDATWRANDQWAITGQAIATAIDRPLATKNGSGVWARIDYTSSPALRQELELTHFDRTLDFNDMGFQRRASLNEVEWTVQYQQNIDDPESVLRGRNWRSELQARTNDNGDQLPTALILDHIWQFRSGASLLLDVSLQTPGFNDLISRGNGLVHLPERQTAYMQYTSRRLRSWAFEARGSWYVEGLKQSAVQAGIGAIYYASDSLTIDGDLNLADSSGWLIWNQGTLFGAYQREQINASLNLNWFPADRHEFRVKLQWLGINAHDADPYRIGARGRLQPSDDALADFSIANIGLQLRYRWEFAPQSDLYLVYGRGGFIEQDGVESDFGALLETALELRDADQFLVKVRKRF